MNKYTYIYTHVYTHMYALPNVEYVRKEWREMIEIWINALVADVF